MPSFPVSDDHRPNNPRQLAMTGSNWLAKPFELYAAAIAAVSNGHALLGQPHLNLAQPASIKNNSQTVSRLANITNPASSELQPRLDMVELAQAAVIAAQFSPGQFSPNQFAAHFLESNHSKK